MESNNDNQSIIEKIDDFLSYLETLKGVESTPYTQDEVDAILEKEGSLAEENYNHAIEKFILEDKLVDKRASSKRFVAYWGYPGAGKSFMTQKLIERFGKEEDCLPFYVIDKDEHRDLFPNLFEHLKDGHIDECEKFAGVTIDYVRKVLSLQLESGSRSILSVGSMGAGSGFKDNAVSAISHGYKPCAVYMAVNPDVAFFSSVYRSAELYNRIIFDGEKLYPRLVSPEYFSRVVRRLPELIERIDTFQRENSENVDLLVVNRKNELLYDSRKPHQMNVLEVIREEENRPLSEKEKLTLNMQLNKVERCLRYRIENNIYPPQNNEIEMIKQAVLGIRKLFEDEGNGGLSKDRSESDIVSFAESNGPSFTDLVGFKQCATR